MLDDRLAVADVGQVSALEALAFDAEALERPRARASRSQSSTTGPRCCSASRSISRVDEVTNGLGQVLVAQDLVALGVDRLALLVDDVVVLDDALADVEVVALDARLGVLDGLGDQPRLDGHVALEAHALHQAGHAVRAEALHQRVFERQVEARRARVALAAGAAAQLVVDAPRLVALGADDVQAAGRDHLLVLGARSRALALASACVVDLRRRLGRVDALGGAAPPRRGPAASPPSMMSVPRPAMLVAIVTAPRRPAWATIGASFSWNLALSTSCLTPRRLSISARSSLFSTLTVPTSTGRPASVISTISSMTRVELGVLVAEDEVRVVVADHRPVGRDGHHVEAVDLVELLLLGHGRAGHAGQLVVEPEVVLEGDRGQRHRLALDAQALLGLDRLVQTVRPAPAGHLAAGELVDDDDLAVLDDVVAVALVQRVRAQRLLEVARQARVRVDVVEVLDAEQLLDLLDALFGRRDGVLLEVDEVVAALLLALGRAFRRGTSRANV